MKNPSVISPINTGFSRSEISKIRIPLSCALTCRNSPLMHIFSKNTPGSDILLMYLMVSFSTLKYRIPVLLLSWCFYICINIFILNVNISNIEFRVLLNTFLCSILRKFIGVDYSQSQITSLNYSIGTKLFNTY